MPPPSERLPITSVKKFYFLKYFYILLEGVARHSDKGRILDLFKTLKQKHRLGESKYKKKFLEGESLTEKQLRRYIYTFEQVIAESKEYRLVDEPQTDVFVLTENGDRLLNTYQIRGEAEANRELLQLMEEKYGAFRFLVEFFYKANPFKSGLVLLPNYPPHSLGIEKSDIKTGRDFDEYIRRMTSRFQEDFQRLLGQSTGEALSNQTLQLQSERLKNRLREINLLPDDPEGTYDLKNHKKITDRVRDFWLTYFLRTIYQYEYSLASFEIWAYRGKQVGVIHATEFYPGITGKVSYPTSVLVKASNNADFDELYRYEDGFVLYAHKPLPTVEENQNLFARHLYNAYVDLRRTNRSLFASIPPLREIVCYNMKISEAVFENLLAEVYRLNLESKLQFSISLEVDRLPEESNAMYIKQEPVVIDGKARNIIAINVHRGERS